MTGLLLFAQLPRQPIVTLSLIVKLLEITPPTVGKAAEFLEGLGVLQEISGRQRDRMFSYARFLELRGAGME